MILVVRISGFSWRKDGKLSGHCFADDDGSRFFETANQCGIELRSSPGMKHSAVLRRKPPGVDNVFNAHRNTVQRSKKAALLQGFIRLSSLIERILRIEVGPGLYRFFKPFDLLETSTHQLLRTDLTQPYLLCCFDST